MISKAKAKANAKWDKEHMANISCRVPVWKKEAFKDACEKSGTSMHAVLLSIVDKKIAEGEK